MSKYDKMIALNKKVSDEKIALAKKAIIEMLEERERITIPKLMDKTGLSRGFFYKNPTIRAEVDHALEQQVGMPNPRKEVLDMAMNQEIAALRHQILVLQRENGNLKEEVGKLKKALKKKNADLLFNL